MDQPKNIYYFDNIQITRNIVIMIFFFFFSFVFMKLFNFRFQIKFLRKKKIFIIKKPCIKS